MPSSKWFRIGYGIILILLIIYLATLVDFIFEPVLTVFRTLFPPILIGGILFYLFRPLVNWLHRKMPRGLAILIIFVLFFALVTCVILIVGPLLQQQILNLAKNTPAIVTEIQSFIENLLEAEWLSGLTENAVVSLDDIVSYISDHLYDLLSTISTNLLGVVSFLTSFLLIIVIIPFVLYYLLKDGSKFPNYILRFIPSAHREEGRRILSDMDSAVSSYVIGQVLVSICVGVLAYIAYLIIGLDYSLILALIVMVTNVIPYFGPFIGTSPAVIVGLIDSPLTALWVVLAILVIQQVEGNIISPQIMGRRLSVHPLTIILLVLSAGQIAGVLGMILAVPLYAVLKVFAKHTYHLYKLRREAKQDHV